MSVSNPPRIVVTRPVIDAQPITKELISHRYTTLTEPLSSIIFPHHPPLCLNGAGAVIFTSANGVRALSQNTPDRTLPVYAVGDASAQEAQKQGFKNILSAKGNNHDLARLIISHEPSKTQRLIHCAASQSTKDLGHQLMDHGFNYERHILYHAQAASSLTPTFIHHLRQHEIQGILFFSPRNAQTFSHLIEEISGQNELKFIHACGLSQAVCKHICHFQWKSLSHSPQPNQAQLITTLKKCISS